MARLCLEKVNTSLLDWVDNIAKELGLPIFYSLEELKRYINE